LQLSNQRGSAVAEFVLLAMPLCLLVIGATNYCLNVLLDTTLRNQTLAVARFASLADVSLEQGNDRLDGLCADLPDSLLASCELDRNHDGIVIARVAYQPMNMVVYIPGRVSISAAVALEVR
jgi:hypothetical protein